MDSHRVLPPVTAFYALIAYHSTTARIARIVVPGAAHHITQRGNNRQDVFFADEGRGVYLDLLRRYGERFGPRMTGYCLMTNHVHLVGVPAWENWLSKAVGRAHHVRTPYINRRRGRVGHRWQNRCYSCARDEAHALNALACVDLQPCARAWCANRGPTPGPARPATAAAARRTRCSMCRAGASAPPGRAGERRQRSLEAITGDRLQLSTSYHIVFDSGGDYGSQFVERLQGVRIVGYVGKGDDEAVGRMYMRSHRLVVEFGGRR